MKEGLRLELIRMLFGGQWRNRPTTKTPSGGILTNRIPVPPQQMVAQYPTAPAQRNSRSRWLSHGSTPYP